jgi:hypothetical protein
MLIKEKIELIRNKNSNVFNRGSFKTSGNKNPRSGYQVI